MGDCRVQSFPAACGGEQRWSVDVSRPRRFSAVAGVALTSNEKPVTIVTRPPAVLETNAQSAKYKPWCDYEPLGDAIVVRLLSGYQRVVGGAWWHWRQPEGIQMTARRHSENKQKAVGVLVGAPSPALSSQSLRR